MNTIMDDRPPPDHGGRTRRVFDALDEGIIVQAADGTVRDWNAAASRLLGVPEAAIAGRAPVPEGWSVVWERPGDCDSDTTEIRSLLACARKRGSITVGVDGGDALRWITIASHTVQGDEDAETVVATMTDVTAQREAQRESARYRQIFDTLDASYRILEESPIGMCSVDADGFVLRSNMAFLALAGAETTSVFEVVPREDRSTLRHAFARLMEGGAPSVHIETRVRRPTGEANWCEITAVAMRQGSPDAAILLLINDVTERRQREIRLRQLAERDPLTGLHNRRTFVQSLRERLASLEAPRRSAGEWALLLIDLDGFKEVNDTCGHARGDAVLVAVAEAIRDRTRADDVVGRLGGDEFAVMFRSRMGDAVAIGEQIIARISQAAASVDGTPPVTASVGIARLRPGDRADDALDAADRAMYRAKRAGKARAVEAAV